MRNVLLTGTAGAILSALLALSALPAAAAGDAARYAALIQKRYETLNSFSADFEQTLTHKESGSTEQRKGRLLFRKPLLIRWQTAKPHEETLVVTGKEIWDYLPDEEIAYRYPPSLVQDSRSIIQVLTGQSALTRDFDVKESGTEDGLVRLTLLPHEPAPQMVEATIWIEPESGYIRRAKIIDFYGNANDVRFTSFRPDTRIPAGEFRFTPPADVEVEDRIDRPVQERELFK